MQTFDKLISILSGWVWGPPMLILLVGTGIYLTIRLKGLQFRALPMAFRMIWHKDHGHAGDISHFQALMTALAATVGIGNIVGVATAITLGGPGAVFWMWMTGLVGMVTKYSEAVLAVKYREHGPHGMRGGPMYYISKGVGLPWLGTLFAVFTAIATFGIGNMTQANATAGIFATVFHIEPWVTGLVLMVLTALVIIGGIKSIGKFTSFLVPIMILGYVISSLVVLVLNAGEIPHAFVLIFRHAFSPAAATGGFAGATIAAAMRFGVARGVFSNESGLGSAPIAAAAARTHDPVKQALVSMTQTFIDTLVVCTMTALVILTATSWTQGVGPGELTSASFAETLGSSGRIIVAISTALFAYSTLIGWNYYGEKAIEYLLGPKSIRVYRILFIAVVLVGAMTKLETVWNFSDLMNGMMAIPNLIGLLVLSKVIKDETDRYFKSKISDRIESETNSYVRAWAERRARELRRSNDVTPKNLFAAAIYGLSAFGKSTVCHDMPKPIRGLDVDVSKHFGTDATLFEVGCYLYFRLDLWLFRNKPDIRQDISVTFGREFCRLFTQALGMDNLPELFKQRIDKYGELARLGDDIKKHHFYLSQLILRTKDGTRPASYDFDCESLSLDFFDDTLVMAELLTWESSIIPALIESMSKYCDMVE